MDTAESTRNCEEDLLDLQPIMCTEGYSNEAIKPGLSILASEDINKLVNNQEDNCFKTVEEGWLLVEHKPNIQDPDKGNQQVGDSAYSNREDDKWNYVLFKDRERSKTEVFYCKLCHRVFANKYKLMSHQFKIHGLKKMTKGRPRTKESKRDTVPKENWTPDVQKLARKESDGTKIFVCDQCPYTVKRCDSMTKHVLRVHSKGLVMPQYMCEVCGKTFFDRAYLRNHALSHTKEQQYFCEICGRKFHRQPSLKRHIQSHSNEKQFSCLLCDYKTNRKHLMYKHAENHRTGKAYSCKFCSAKFYTQLCLRKHIYTHNLTHNSCSFCKIGFSSRERMWCHMERIHFPCELKYLKTEDFEKQCKLKVEYIEVKVESKTR